MAKNPSTERTMSKAPETLLEAVRYFADEDVALAFLADLRWPDGEPACPACGLIDKHYFLASRKVWKCRSCKKQFSIKVGTIMEDSALPLSKWLPAMWLIANCKNGISSYELARALDISQKAAWFMLHRIRLAMQDETAEPFSGEVEADESYFGPDAKWMHASKKKAVLVPPRHRHGRGPAMKRLSFRTAVMGVLQRGTEETSSKVRTKVVRKAETSVVREMVRESVKPGSTLYTDEHNAYRALDGEYLHDFISHTHEYVRGRVHTNGIESFWSLIKRTIKGTYVSVAPFHLFRYLDEQSFRFNERKGNDRDRFLNVLNSIIDKRLTFAELIGAEEAIA